MTYVSPGLESGRVDGVLMESPPFLKLVLGELVVFGCVPLEHGWLELDTDAGAEFAHDALWIVEEVVGVDDADLVACVSIGVPVSVGRLSGDGGPDDAFVLQVVENAALFVVTGLFWHEVVEAGDVVERWDGAAPVAGNAVDGVADQKGKVELLKDLLWDDGRVVGLGDGWVGVWRGVRVDCTVDRVVVADGERILARRDYHLQLRSAWSDLLLGRGLGTNTALPLLQRRSDGGRVSTRRNQIVGDVLYEDLLVFLLVGKYSYAARSWQFQCNESSSDDVGD